MLNKDPKKRPSIKRLLEKDFICTRVAQLLPTNNINEIRTDLVAEHVFENRSIDRDESEFPNIDITLDNRKPNLVRHTSSTQLPSVTPEAIKKNRKVMGSYTTLPTNQEEDDGEEDLKERTQQKFLFKNGQTVHLEGVSENDSIF